MSDLESSSHSSSSDGEDGNIDDSSDSDSSSSSSEQGSPKNNNQSWVLSKTSPKQNTIPQNQLDKENTDDDTEEDDIEIKVKRGPKEDLRQLWESNPQIYGVRRSSRARREPERLAVLQESDDAGNNRRGGRRRSRNEDYTGTLTDSESDSASEFNSPPSYRRKARPSKLSQMRARLQGKQNVSGGRRRKNVRSYASDETSSDEEGRPKRSSTRTQHTTISYKEESQDETDSDDVVEVIEKEDETANSECIERIMDDRIGKPDAIGETTTWYAVHLHGDPNEGFDSETSAGVQQYLISWKGWSHIHNTWESEEGLREQKVRGLKKLENYIRKKDEVDAWLRVASPEDAEYFLCQQELGRDLVTTYRKVERVIGETA